MILADNIIFPEQIINYMWLFWIVGGLIFIGIEIFTEGFFASLIGIAAIATGLLAFVVKIMLVQLAFFVVVMILMLVYLRPIFIKYFGGKTKRRSNVEAIIGKEVFVDQDIDNLKGEGYVKDGADYWKARSVDGSPITKGEIVIIENMEGITAFVRLKNKKSEGEE